jgi:hypothetical protein
MTEQNQNMKSAIKLEVFADSIILVFKDKLQLEVVGGAKDAARFMRPWGHKAKDVKDSREVRFRGRDVILSELVTAAEKSRKAAEAAAKAEIERRANPHPGREPERRTPQARRSA